jgi:hypothetical protein
MNRMPERGSAKWRARGAGVLGLVAASFGSIGSGAASGGDPTAQASTVYDCAAAAQARGDYRTAARLFSQADDLAPEPTALEAALEAGMLANDAALVMDLVARATARGTTGTLAATAKTAAQRFSGRAGQLTVDCVGCAIGLDGEPFPAGVKRWVTVGEHALRASAGAWSTVETVTVFAREHTTHKLNPGREPAQPPARARGLSPGWFAAAAGLTALAGGATIASGMHTLSLHRDFETAPSQDLSRRGQAAETRTYVVGAATGMLGLATILVGTLGVRWTDPPTSAGPTLVPWTDGTQVGLAGRL